MKNIWKYVVAAFTLLLGAFLYEKSKKEDAEAKLDNSNTKKEDAVLNQHTQDLKDQDENAKVLAENLKNSDTPKEDLLKFLNKDKK